MTRGTGQGYAPIDTSWMGPGAQGWFGMENVRSARGASTAIQEALGLENEQRRREQEAASALDTALRDTQGDPFENPVVLQAIARTNPALASQIHERRRAAQEQKAVKDKAEAERLASFGAFGGAAPTTGLGTLPQAGTWNQTALPQGAEGPAPAQVGGTPYDTFLQSPHPEIAAAAKLGAHEWGNKLRDSKYHGDRLTELAKLQLLNDEKEAMRKSRETTSQWSQATKERIAALSGKSGKSGKGGGAGGDWLDRQDRETLSKLVENLVPPKVDSLGKSEPDKAAAERLIGEVQDKLIINTNGLPPLFPEGPDEMANMVRRYAEAKARGPEAVKQWGMQEYARRGVRITPRAGRPAMEVVQPPAKPDEPVPLFPHQPQGRPQGAATAAAQAAAPQQQTPPAPQSGWGYQPGTFDFFGAGRPLGNPAPAQPGEYRRGGGFAQGYADGGPISGVFGKIFGAGDGVSARTRAQIAELDREGTTPQPQAAPATYGQATGNTARVSSDAQLAKLEQMMRARGDDPARIKAVLDAERKKRGFAKGGAVCHSARQTMRSYADGGAIRRRDQVGGDVLYGHDDEIPLMYRGEIQRMGKRHVTGKVRRPEVSGQAPFEGDFMAEQKRLREAAMNPDEGPIEREMRRRGASELQMFEHKRTNPRREMAGGGPVRGPGTETSDSIPAVINGQEPAALSDGEYVLNAEAVKLAGQDKLDRLNQAGLRVRHGRTGPVR